MTKIELRVYMNEQSSCNIYFGVSFHFHWFSKAFLKPFFLEFLSNGAVTQHLQHSGMKNTDIRLKRATLTTQFRYQICIPRRRIAYKPG